MMLKTITLLAARPGLVRDAFRHHYETVHVPLIESLVPEIVEYRRNYVRHGLVPALQIGSGPGVVDFDVLTATWISGQDAVRHMMARLAAGDGERIAEDEARFVDRDRMHIFPVEEFSTSPTSLGLDPSQMNPVGPSKVLMLLTARSGISRRYFVERFEGDYMPALLEAFREGARSLFSGHVRNYLIPGKKLDLGHVEQQSQGPGCDVILEGWFHDAAGLERFLEARAHTSHVPEWLALEGRLVASSRTLVVPVDECISRNRGPSLTG